MVKCAIAIWIDVLCYILVQSVSLSYSLRIHVLVNQILDFYLEHANVVHV